jgi:hypothetical protein
VSVGTESSRERFASNARYQLQRQPIGGGRSIHGVTMRSGQTVLKRALDRGGACGD